MAEAQAHQDAPVPISTSTPSQDNEKPAILIIGGLGELSHYFPAYAFLKPPKYMCVYILTHPRGPGYIGRFLALHIHKNNLASEVRLVDKVLPQLAWLAPEFAEACSQDKFMQADASRERKFYRSITLRFHAYRPPSTFYPPLTPINVSLFALS